MHELVGEVVRSGAGSSGSDLGEDPVQFFGQELWPGVGDAEGTGVAGAQLASPLVYVLEDVAVNRLKVADVEDAVDGGCSSCTMR